MAQEELANLERRLARLEENLRKANEDVRTLRERLRRTARLALAVCGGLGALVLALTLIVSSPAASSSTITTFHAPFQIFGKNNNLLMSVEEGRKGGVIYVYDSHGARVAVLGANVTGYGGLLLSSPDQQTKLAGEAGVLTLTQGEMTVNLGAASEKGGLPGLNFSNRKGVSVVSLRVQDSGSAFLHLGNVDGVPRVEAGTLRDDRGAVRVFGKKGECKVSRLQALPGGSAVAPPPCEMLGQN